ncbi:uncharacterized protein LOC106093701 isoform X1 [Stomoxys calcitrans]|uniref:uncharacterized protein LOC106093701 isoform X1 n=1 Tax=Stomoxys calcitrans TaxID=35570 RepID=UPI0027E2BF2C|nr:uncharacterized protein LOC106093701 isoform X1 [Stomoxys calcitrans]
MPPKKSRKSRQNSVADLSDVRIEKKSIVPNPIQESSKKSLEIEEKSLGAKSSKQCNENGSERDKETKSSYKIVEVLSRTSLLILEYHQYKAARCIQRFVRGWLARILYRRKKWASIIIQTEWRRFHARRLYYRKLEAVLQQRLEEHYFKSAQKIQAIWRGWWVREHVYNQKHLLRLQIMAGEDLLHCVAFKLHYLLRTYQIPGVFSLRNSKALSKVEALLASMRFKKHNDCQHETNAHAVPQTQKNSLHSTRLKFQNDCMAKCLSLYSEKQADRKMNKILNMYQEANGAYSGLKMQKPRSKCTLQKSENFKSPSTTFCGEIVSSMKKWKVMDENKLQLDPKVFQQPEILENFLKEIESWWNRLQDNYQ